jgi:disulfide bond formation protein DsbB
MGKSCRNDGMFQPWPWLLEAIGDIFPSIAGWWFWATYPSEKWWTEWVTVGMMTFHSQLFLESHKIPWFQTTNQIKNRDITVKRWCLKHEKSRLKHDKLSFLDHQNGDSYWESWCWPW